MYKCRFCDWRTFGKFTNKSGHYVSNDEAYEKLMLHVRGSHWEELEQEMEDFDVTCED